MCRVSATPARSAIAIDSRFFQSSAQESMRPLCNPRSNPRLEHGLTGVVASAAQFLERYVQVLASPSAATKSSWAAMSLRGCQCRSRRSTLVIHGRSGSSRSRPRTSCEVRYSS